MTRFIRKISSHCMVHLDRLGRAKRHPIKRSMRAYGSLALLIALAAGTYADASEEVTRSWSMAEFGTPLYDENMTH